MFRRAFLAAGLFCAASTLAFADFSYEQTSKITGGMMASMMKLAGAFSKTAREPMTSTVLVKGDRMAHVGTNRISVIDLKKETITDIDTQKKTYATITFAQMAEAMQRMSDKMAAQSKEKNADMNLKASIKETGEKKVISGFNTKEVILTMEMEATDQKSGQKGAMTVTSDMWLAPSVPGYEEVREFYKRMSQKIAWTPGSNAMAMQQRGDIMKGMGALAKEAAKMDGVPILQLMKMGAAGDGTNMSSSSGNSQPKAKESAPPPSAGEVAGSALGGRLGGLAGGLGGFGRKKKQQAEEQQPAQQQEVAANSGSGDASGALMEMTTELTAFSSAPVDTSKFEIPAGYKQVEHPMEKALK